MLRDLNVPLSQEEITVHLSADNSVDEDAIETFHGYKSD